MSKNKPILTLALDCDSAIALVQLCLFEKGFLKSMISRLLQHAQLLLIRIVPTSMIKLAIAR